MTRQEIVKGLLSCGRRLEESDEHFLSDVCDKYVDLDDALRAATATMEILVETLQRDGHILMANEMRKQIADFKQTLGIS